MSSASNSRANYWDEVLAGFAPTSTHQLWRAHSDAINRRLIARWMPGPRGRLLKTDLFDEAVGDGLIRDLVIGAEAVSGVDISPAVVASAHARYPELDARTGDLLELPFPDGAFATIFSNSTLDHFDSLALLNAAMRELFRVLRPGGSLVITLDNRANPIIALRTSGCFSILNRMGIVPYYVGATLGPWGLARALENAGFALQDTAAVMHCPPQLAAALRTRRDSSADTDVARHVSGAMRFEALGRWPTRWLSAHFIAARATRP